VTLVLLHGALASGSQLGGLAARLGRPGAHAPDLAGHGARPAEPMTLERFVDDALTDEPADLVGYSLGGYVALAAAIAYPERVRRVVTIATKLAWTPEVAAAEARRLDPDHLAERHPGPGWRPLVEHTAAFLTGLGTAPPLDVDRIACPALVLVGDADTMVTREECEDAVRRISGARLGVLPGQPHQYERMDLDVLAPPIADFLR